MLIAYGVTLLLTKLALEGWIPLLVSETSFTLLLGVSALKMYGLARASRGLAWQRGLFTMAVAALIITLHNLAWVYGSFVGEVPLGLEFVGATLYTLQVVPWAFALSTALFTLYDRMRGALYLELFTYLVGLIAAVVFVVAVLLGFVFSLSVGIAIADSAGLYLSAALLVPAVALWCSGKDASLTRPFLYASAATAAWFCADALYLYLPEARADMAYNCLALVQWFLFYRAAQVYVRGASSVEEEEHPVTLGRDGSTFSLVK